MNSSNLLTLVLRIFVTVLLGWAGFQKISGAPESVALFTSLEMEPHGRHLIGLLELAAAILVLFPVGVVPGAILTWGLMSGAILAHISKIGFEGQAGILFGAALAALLSSTAIIYLKRTQIGFLNRMFKRTGAESS